jgi:ubiquinone/menaquinone biosynthesis C-methylase UbiE
MTHRDLAFWKYNWLARRAVVASLERARPHTHGLLLDVGCGARPFDRVFDGAVERSLGLDLPASPDLAPRGEGRRPDVFARAEALPFREGSLDAVMAISLMEFLPDPSRFLREACRALRPGGAALVEFPQMTPMDPRATRAVLYSRESAINALEQSGFEVVEAIPIGGSMTRAGLSAILALNRLNRGPWRVLTELPVRLLYVVLQLGFAGLDVVWFRPRGTAAHLLVGRRRA